MKTVLIYPSEVTVARRADLERDARLAQLFDANYAPLCRLAYVILGDAQRSDGTTAWLIDEEGEIDLLRPTDVTGVAVNPSFLD